MDGWDLWDAIAEAGSDAALREDAAAIHLTAIHSTEASKDRSDTVAASTAFAVEAATGLKARSYLRVAQAYMLISMPTDTSTIFGAFQAIRGLPRIERDIAPGKT
jgi:hypothetical protein